MTLREAAESLGVTPDTLRQQIAAGRLAATKLGPIWTIEPGELERYRAESQNKPIKSVDYRQGYQAGWYAGRRARKP